MRGSPNLEMAKIANLTYPRKIHIVGIGGSGMSALGEVLVGSGHLVSGSEIKETQILERLRSLGITIYLGHRESQIADAEIVAYSTAIPVDNIELLAAKAAGAEVLHRSEVLAGLTRIKKSISIAGTHGKTTTSALISLALSDAKLRPSFVLGSEVNEVGAAASWDEGAWLVIEADESDGTFLHLKSEIAIVSSVERDHVEYYGSYEKLQDAFGEFLGSASIKIVGSDDPCAFHLGSKHSAITVGVNKKSDFRIENIELNKNYSRFSLVQSDGKSFDIHSPLLGMHNVKNLAIAFVGAKMAGADEESLLSALGRFGGVPRRFESRGSVNGIGFIDDYAHLPGEVKPTLETARLFNPERLVAVFQPHRFTRTRDLASEFADAFCDADMLYVTDIYSAGERILHGVNASMVVQAIKENNPNFEVYYEPSRDQLVEKLSGLLRSGDILITLGAGDLTSLPDQIKTMIQTTSLGRNQK